MVDIFRQKAYSENPVDADTKWIDISGEKFKCRFKFVMNLKLGDFLGYWYIENNSENHILKIKMVIENHKKILAKEQNRLR